MTSPPSQTTVESGFDSFNIYTTSYKKIGDHEIEVSILISKDLKPGKHPLIVKWHGGCLVTGTALYAPWLSHFWPPFITRNNAITILPNYRLIPEHNGHDILSDIFSFWAWFSVSLSPFLATIDPSIELDFAKLLVSGESAGGHMAIHSALMTPPGLVKAMLFQYPMTSYLAPVGTALPFNQEAPDPKLIDDYIARIVPGTIVSSVVPPEKMDLAFALSAHERWREFFGYKKGLLPIEAVEDAKGFPPTWILHGGSDSLVGVEDSKKFVKKVGEVLGEEVGKRVRLHIEPGADHGFDGGLKEEDTPWLKEGLEWVEEQWLA